MPIVPQDATTLMFVTVFVAASFSLRSCDEEIDQAQAKACGYEELKQICRQALYRSP